MKVSQSRDVATLRKMVCGELRENESLVKHTTLRTGGPADLLLVPQDEADVRAAWNWALDHELPVTFLGNGSNVLVASAGVRGLVMKSGRGLDHIEFNETAVTAGAGVPVAKLVYQAAERGLAGLERLAGIPGTVGGALVMNAGTSEGEAGDILEWARVLGPDGEVHTWGPEDLELGYRQSRLQHDNYAVLDARFLLTPADRDDIRARLAEYDARRVKTQPVGKPTAGSTFKNPGSGKYAGYLLDRAGVKGMREGGAQVSTLHANFILNVDQATPEDVLRLMHRMRQKVQEQFGVTLEPEVRFLGQWPGPWVDGLPPV